MSAPVILIIRDGWGISPNGKASAEAEGNATLLATTPVHEQLYARYPMGTLSASGMDVGLPDGQMGNSEVGHLNLGAGRIVYQDFTRINKAITDGELAGSPVLKEAFEKAKSGRLHLLGLVSDGGVHSHQDHLVALATAAHDAGVADIAVHAITDGRDTSPTGGAGYLDTVTAGLAPTGAKVFTVIGRYFAMDRDNRWDRNKLAWDAIVLGRGEVSEQSPGDAIRAQYEAGETDEFLQPLIFEAPDQPRVRDGDVVLFFNFRADRARQLSRAFLFPDFDGYDREVTPHVHYVTLTQYDKTYPCQEVFGPQTLDHILGEVVSAAGKTQLRIAETEKYPHVTYFFNGGVEKAYDGEDRQIIPSPKVATYDLQPEMSAPAVTDKVLELLPQKDLVILNFANPDMVGHTGVVEAGIRAVERIDAAVGAVIDKVLELGGKALVTADHGNCERMRNPDGSPNTAHTTNLVHVIYVAADAGQYHVRNGILADVAPTLLDMMGLTKPAEMTGTSLLEKIA
jgi:2,3-bisphosphoglycerate-independent phosphoglycerate mutase